MMESVSAKVADNLAVLDVVFHLERTSCIQNWSRGGMRSPALRRVDCTAMLLLALEIRDLLSLAGRVRGVEEALESRGA